MPPLSEIALVGFTLIGWVASPVLLATAPTEEQYALQWLLLPMLGSLLASVCAMLLNPRAEVRKHVLARGIFGVVMGTACPKIVSMVHPALANIFGDPAFKCIFGFFVCLFFYVVAKPVVEKLYGRSDSMSEDLLNTVESQVKKKVSTVTVTETETGAK